MKSKIAYLIFCLIFFTLLELNRYEQKSLTFDEPVHLLGGYSILEYSDFRINPENGVLPQICGALPTVFFYSRLIAPDNYNWRKMKQWALADDFLLNLGGDMFKVVYWGRFMMLLLACAFITTLFFMALKICHSSKSAYFIVLLIIFSPTFSANAGLINSDIASAFFFLLSAYFFHCALREFSILNATLAGLSSGALFLSKLSAPLIIFVYLFLIVIQMIRGKTFCNGFGKRFVIRGRIKVFSFSIALLFFVGMLVFFSLWITAGFRYSLCPNESNAERMEIDKKWHAYGSSTLSIPMKTILQFKRYRILPEFYLLGSAKVIANMRGRYSFLNGEYSKDGWYTFFPFAFLMKTPPELIVLFLIGILSLYSPLFRISHGVLFTRKRALLTLYEFSAIISIIVVYFSSAIISKFNLGNRHLLPVYAGLFLIASLPVSKINFEPTKRCVLIVGGYIILFLGLLWENISIYPHNLSYFSPLCGGAENGYKHLLGSSLDWGQNLDGLKQYIDKHLQNEDVYIAYFGSLNLKNYGVVAKRLLCIKKQPDQPIFNLGPGAYCISATMLQMVYMPNLAFWNAEDEYWFKRYRKTFLEFDKLGINGRNSLSHAQHESFISNYRGYEVLRFAKLTSILRKRTPDYRIGYSIFVYRLTDKDIQAFQK